MSGLPRYEKAIQAFMSIMNEERAEGESGFTPPPTGTSWRDKKWAAQLRTMWPDYASIRIEKAHKDYAERRKWCEQQSGFYWVAGNGLVWYFSSRETAMLFKLVYGGSEGSE